MLLGIMLLMAQLRKRVIKMTFPLAIYTAEHGLDWHCPSQGLPLSELDQCRTVFGRLPDFDTGNVGFEGIAVCGGWVFVVRCFKAEKWDFQGRDSLYLVVTWMPMEAFGDVDVDELLALSYFREPMRNPPPQFEFDVAGDGEGTVPPSEIKDGLVLRRNIGESRFIRVDVKPGPTEPTPSPPAANAPQPEPPPPSGCKWKSVLWWVLVGVFLAIVLAAFAYDVLNRRGAQKDDGSGKTVEGTGLPERTGGGTNGVSGRTVPPEAGGH